MPKDKGDDTLHPAPVPDLTIYEDAEDDLIEGWKVGDYTPTDATVTNMFDSTRQSQVIDLAGVGKNYEYRLGEGTSPWHNTHQFITQWSIKSTNAFVVYWDVETTGGLRSLAY